MKKLLKLFSLILIQILILSLSACSDGNTADTTAETETEETTAAETTPAVTTADWRLEQKAKGFEYDAESLSYELVWSDEFDYEGEPDPEKWNYDVGGSGWGNNELQYYTRGDNVTVDGEKMILELRKEDAGNRDYTSTRIITKNKGDWQYGKIEVSAKLPEGLGTWPAIWMLPTDWKYGDWPASGEIDIMEHVGYDMNTIHTTVHTKSYNHTSGTQKGKSQKVENVSTEFHKYSIEWLPDKILFFIDDEEVNSFEPSKLITAPTYKEWPFDKRFHLLINIAFGGNWGGAQGVDENCIPVTMEIDYVRVYQSPEINALIAE